MLKLLSSWTAYDFFSQGWMGHGGNGRDYSLHHKSFSEARPGSHFLSLIKDVRLLSYICHWLCPVGTSDEILVSKVLTPTFFLSSSWIIYDTSSSSSYGIMTLKSSKFTFTLRFSKCHHTDKGCLSRYFKNASTCSPLPCLGEEEKAKMDVASTAAPQVEDHLCETSLWLNFSLCHLFIIWLWRCSK